MSSFAHHHRAVSPPGTLRVFSVVVPAYNEEALLSSFLDSLLVQDFAGPYEIIVVGKNSTDGCAGDLEPALRLAQNNSS